MRPSLVCRSANLRARALRTSRPRLAREGERRSRCVRPPRLLRRRRARAGGPFPRSRRAAAPAPACRSLPKRAPPTLNGPRKLSAAQAPSSAPAVSSAPGGLLRAGKPPRGCRFPAGPPPPRASRRAAQSTCCAAPRLRRALRGRSGKRPAVRQVLRRVLLDAYQHVETARRSPALRTTCRAAIAPCRWSRAQSLVSGEPRALLGGLPREPPSNTRAAPAPPCRRATAGPRTSRRSSAASPAVAAPAA